ncbi:hypothetical protein [Dictyobacter aurantiacus]|uniref:Uncharacterized protein n=1 Tax=Dictyobacter aurantiacus TaxID=1936993 RepID=A0A401Z8C5_9CHLR|nr:hypothetical protein [Dictyobacter aurantiacus]GCE03095.1 hypothetical protein KDAU_04240 [Dictyobacter aurantiacus]
MSNNPSPLPTPVAAPTAVPYSLPDIPPNALTMLDTLADSIDTANKKLSGHASKLGDIHTSTDNAVTEVTTHSKGQATDTLSNLWTGSKSDITHAQGKLTDITSPTQGMGSNPSDFRSILNEHRGAIKTGLNAMATLQSQAAASIPAEQLQQLKQDIDNLNSSIGNVSMALDAMAMLIATLNNTFLSGCATGLVPGHPVPHFNQNAFAHQAHGDAPGDGKSLSADDLRNEMKAKSGGREIDPEVLAFLPDLAIEHGLDLENVKAFIDTGADPQLLYKWINEDKGYNPAITDKWLTQTTGDIKILTDLKGDPTESAEWLKGLNADQLEAVKNRAADSPKMELDNLKHLVDPQLKFKLNEKHDVPRSNVGPQPKNPQIALNNSVTFSSETTTRRIGVDPETGQLVVIDDTNNGTYHAHVRLWDSSTPQLQGLTQDMKNALVDNGLITKKGEIILRNKKGKFERYGMNVIKGK